MGDFIVTSVPWMLNQQVTTYDEANNVVPDDRSWHEHAAETVYVFVEFLAAKGLLNPSFDASRRLDLELRFSDLTADGQAFARFALHKWMGTLDRRKSKVVDAKGLEKYWSKFSATR